MNRNGALLGSLLLCGCGAWAQPEAPKIVVNLAGFRYPPIAGTARIQGDVLFEVSASGQKLTSDTSRLLAEPAARNVATWTLPPLRTGKYLIAFHFKILDQVGVKRETVPIGNKFERFLRHLVGAKTKIVVNRCYKLNDPSPHFEVAASGQDVRIDVFAETPSGCLNTESSQVARNSHF
jgi:hypothetical protein